MHVQLVAQLVVALCACAGAAVGACQHQPDAIRDGLELETWEERNKTSKKGKVFMLSMTLLSSVYAGVTQSAFEILTCSDRPALSAAGQTRRPRPRPRAAPRPATRSTRFASGPATTTAWARRTTRREKLDAHGLFMVLAVVSLLLVTIGVPLLFWRMIDRAAPVGSLEDKEHRYNDDGDLVEYTKAMYAADLKLGKHKAHPAHFLVKGYERPWRHYKVTMMCFKAALAVVVVGLADSPLAQAGLSLVLYGAFSGLSLYSAPFLSNACDRVDQFKNVGSTLTCLLGMIGTAAPSAAGASSGGCTVISALGGVAMVVRAAAENDAVKRKLKSLFHSVSFSNRVTELEGTAEEILPSWDVPKELRRRLWLDFWDGLILSAYKDDAPVVQRLMELKDIAQEKGLRRIEAHYAHAFDPTFQRAQAILLRALEGVDVYYDRPPADGHLDSATRMGKMYVHPFPFHAVMVYDDSKDHAFIHEVDDLQYLAAVNMTPAAIAKRELREVFRAFAVCGSLVRHHYEEDRISGARWHSPGDEHG